MKLIVAITTGILIAYYVIKIFHFLKDKEHRDLLERILKHEQQREELDFVSGSTKKDYLLKNFKRNCLMLMVLIILASFQEYL